MINRWGVKRSVLGCGFVLLASCSSDKPGNFISSNSNGGSSATGNRPGTAGSSGVGAGTRGGAAGTSGKEETSDAGDSGTTENSRLAPTLEVTTPKPVADPNKGEVITDSQVVVTCLATASKEAGATPVLTSSLRIQMFGDDGQQIGMDAAAHPTDKPNEYTASFALTDVPNGAVSFTCLATDQSSPPHMGSDTVATFVDHGPAITLTNPEQGSAHAIAPAILFKFSALDSPLTAKDEKAGVSSVTLKVNGLDLGDMASSELPGMPGQYQRSIDLGDPAVFSPTPTGPVPVRIVAKNERGAIRTSDFSFTVDNLGPTIQITAPPTPNQFIGGKVTLAFTVSDVPAGIAANTVKVIFNSGAPIVYSKDDKNWAHPSDTVFTYTFDTKNFDSKISLAVMIRADDVAGNASDGASIQYYVDNVPPIIDMAPPQVQELKPFAANVSVCSEPFFPLGKSPKDLEIVGSVTRLRALLWDEGNAADGQDAFYFSDIDNSNTNTIPHLYFQTDTSKPLLKNSDPTKHGEVCNAIADETLPFLTLVPLPPTGLASYKSTVTPIPGVCEAGTESQDQTKLCGGNSDLTRVIQHELGLSTPVVAAVYVIPPDAFQCTGSQFELTNIANADGWVCAAVTAIDRTGNRSVSAPLRLCLDADPPNVGSAKYAGSPPCAVSSIAPPSCVQDCVPPQGFKRSIIKKP
jgi:hypothetical protein